MASGRVRCGLLCRFRPSRRSTRVRLNGNGTLELFSAGRQTDWRNRLIWGDKKYVLPSLLPEFAGKVNLVYIDPPFDTGADFSYSVNISDNPEDPEDEGTTFVKQPSILEQKAYRDTWGKGQDSYFPWFHETVVILKELLAEDGCMYVHSDWRLAHYVKVILDEVFGKGQLLSERRVVVSDAPFL